jgi:prepilin-type N-terminal cleavage/methylation domain-containing protein
MTSSKKGFTMIELLIVIAIIGVLTAIILASLGESRNKARNAAINTQAIQYMNAIELYRDSNSNNLPLGSGADSGSFFYCVGSGNCLLNGSTIMPDTTFNQSIAPYIGPALIQSATLGTNYGGIIYECTGGTTSCRQSNIIGLRWFLSGANKTCSRGATATTLAGPVTQCFYRF